MSGGYVHGYDERESTRLTDQARTLEDLLHHDTAYPAGSSVLEAGCGTGAQTVELARRSPQAVINSIDLSAASVRQAQARVRSAGFRNVRVQVADLFASPFPPSSFDHVFVCFVLEHLPKPLDALLALMRLVRPGGTVTVIEGDHGSAFFHPDSAEAHDAIACQVELQKAGGGNANIGRELYPLLSAAGLQSVRVSPRFVYADGSRPGMVDGFTRRTFTAMIEGVREPALAAGMINANRFDAGIRALNRTAEPGGVFCYTFFKGTGICAG